jgi:hypothetical protein
LTGRALGRRREEEREVERGAAAVELGFPLPPRGGERGTRGEQFQSSLIFLKVMLKLNLQKIRSEVVTIIENCSSAAI